MSDSGWFANTLSQRILSYYRRNPGEWLAYKDMALKFGCGQGQAMQACAWLHRSGAATRHSTKDGRLVLVQLRPLKGEGA